MRIALDVMGGDHAPHEIRHLVEVLARQAGRADVQVHRRGPVHSRPHLLEKPGDLADLFEALAAAEDRADDLDTLVVGEAGLEAAVALGVPARREPAAQFDARVVAADADAAARQEALYGEWEALAHEPADHRADG